MKYFGKFLLNLATTAAPLYRPLQENAPWVWGKGQNVTFTEVKRSLQSSDLLVHFDSDKQLILVCDTSPYGLEAVISHLMDDDSEKPIAFALHTFAPAERRYTQLDMEALSTVFRVKRFYQYLYGWHFIIIL